MNKKLSLSMNRDFIFGYPGAVDGQGKTTWTTNSWCEKGTPFQFHFGGVKSTELFTIWFTMEALTLKQFNLFMEEISVAAGKTTSNSHTYWTMPVITDEWQKQWSRDIMLYDTYRHTRRFWTSARTPFRYGRVSWRENWRKCVHFLYNSHMKNNWLL